MSLSPMGETDQSTELRGPTLVLGMALPIPRPRATTARIRSSREAQNYPLPPIARITLGRVRSHKGVWRIPNLLPWRDRYSRRLPKPPWGWCSTPARRRPPRTLQRDRSAPCVLHHGTCLVYQELTPQTRMRLVRATGQRWLRDSELERISVQQEKQQYL